MNTFTKTLTTADVKALAAATIKYNAQSNARPMTDMEYLDEVVGSTIRAWHQEHFGKPAEEFRAEVPKGVAALVEAGSLTQEQADLILDAVAPNRPKAAKELIEERPITQRMRDGVASAWRYVVGGG